MTITTADKLKELRREMGQRKRVYARLIENGKLTQEAANRQIAILESIILDYEAKEKAEQPQGSLGI
ncbi:MAG: hypothetical protein ACK4MV_16235 [Beijerinckiaceae bacterium]